MSVQTRLVSISISIHALLAESDGLFMLYDTTSLIFLSTLSLRRATRNGGRSWMYVLYFYPRSPCGERPGAVFCFFFLEFYFYPRSPCGERRLFPCLLTSILTFLSTLSLRRATAPNHNPCSRSRNFYPRSPCGERLLAARWVLLTRIFLSTLSLRRATKAQTLKIPPLSISIHALLAESDKPPASGCQ